MLRDSVDATENQDRFHGKTRFSLNIIPEGSTKRRFTNDKGQMTNS